MDRLVSLFPEEWRGLFSALDNGTKSELCAELWLTEAHWSQYGEVASWSSFLKALSDDEPCASEFGLCFCPRLLAFPENLQRNLLSFIHRHRERFPSDNLLRFVAHLRSNEISNEWVCALLHLIHQHCQSQQSYAQDKVKTEGADVKSDEPIYSFSCQTQASLKDLFSTLRTLNSSSESIADTIKEEDMVKVEGEQKIQSEPESMEVDLDESCHNTFFPSRQSQYLKSQVRSNSDTSIFSQHNCFLEEKLQGMFDQLKELWHRQQRVDQDNLQLIYLCNQEQIAEVCRQLELAGASEEVLSLACEQFTEISQHISYSTAVCFANTCVLPMVLKLEESPTRTLQATILSYAKTFPKQSIEGLFVPCSISADTGTSHTDLLSKVLKESFTDEHKQYYLETFFQQCSQLNEPMLPVLQQLLDAKVYLTEDSVATLIGILESSSLLMSGNLKFGKLLLAVINKYSGQLTPGHVNRLRQTVESNKTFLKRSCLAAINKFKT